jgi:hypothetical protein
MAKIAGAVERAPPPCSSREGTTRPSPSSTTWTSSARPARVSRRAAAFLHGVRDPDDGPRLDGSPSRGAGALREAGQRHAARRRRRESFSERVRLRNRPEEGRPRQAGSRSTARRTGWVPLDGHDDVRPRRGTRGHPGSPGPPSGRSRTRLGASRHSSLVLQAAATRSLEKWIKHYGRARTSYCRMLARIALLSGQRPPRAGVLVLGGQAGRDRSRLHFGADDWGGTLFEENVHRAADYVNKITVDEIVALIREAGLPARAADHALRAGHGPSRGRPCRAPPRATAHDIRSRRPRLERGPSGGIASQAGAPRPASR